MTIPCVLSTVNILGGTIVLRRNDLLLGVDMGLDRQINLLTGGNGETAVGWPKRSGLSGTTSELGEPMYAVGGSSRAVYPGIRPAFGVWAEGSYFRFNDDTGPVSSDGHSGVVYIGADYLVSSSVLIGVLAQFDQTRQDFAGLLSRANSDGWMLGPYATLRISNNVFLQTRAAWGMSQNEVIADPGFEDRLDSTRWLVRGTLLGQYQLGTLDFRPRASIGYIEEATKSYLSSVGVLAPSMTSSLGQAKIGSEIARKFSLAEGTVIEPSVLLEGIWNFQQSVSSPEVDDLAAGPDLRARVELGMTVFAATGMSFGASVSYDGIGTDFQAIGGRARVRVPFN